MWLPRNRRAKETRGKEAAWLLEYVLSLMLMCDIVAGLTIEQIISGQTVTYAENAEISIRDVGDSDSGGSLLCKTDRTDCCGIGPGETRRGEWFYPDGTMVGTSGTGDDFYRDRGASVVRLHRRNNAAQPTGRYCCEVGSVANANARICITLSKYYMLIIPVCNHWHFRHSLPLHIRCTRYIHILIESGHGQQSKALISMSYIPIFLTPLHLYVYA
jgi:hypothetical protein